MTNLCIIYYASNQWVEQSHRQCSLPKSLSRYAHVVFLDGGPEKAVRIDRTTENLTIVKGLTRVLQALGRRNLNILASWYAKWHLRWVRRKFDRVIFLYSGYSNNFHRAIPHDVLVYDCVDPCFSDDSEVQERSENAEGEVISTARHVFATADTLLERCQKYNPHASLLNNACDPAELASDLMAAAPQPDWWPQDRNPIASYLGGVNERIDLDALELAFRQNSNTHFVLAGPVHPSISSRVEELSQLPNVTITGGVPVSDMRYLFANSTVLLIPFKMNPIGDAINPQKMYAYSLLGKPIIGLATQELRRWQNVVISARSKEDFSKAIQVHVRCPLTAKQETEMKAFGLANTWDVRADEAWKIIQTL